MSSRRDHELVRWLGEGAPPAPELVGGKALSLDRLCRLGHRTPAAFCLTTLGFDRYVEENDLADELSDLRARADDEVERAALQALVFAHRLPAAVHHDLVDALASLDALAPGELLAVRSSALAEDGGELSYAGQHETVLGVAPGEAEHALRRCWASLWSERSVAYRVAHGLPAGAGEIAVIVQRLVPADAAAVVFTMDPVTGSREKLVVNTTPGLGEALASGEASGDTYELDRATCAITSTDAAGASYIAPEEAVALARTALEVEDAYGVPVDIEAAFHGGRWQLLQARPVTAGVNDTEDRDRDYAAHR